MDKLLDRDFMALHRVFNTIGGIPVYVNPDFKQYQRGARLYHMYQRLSEFFVGFGLLCQLWAIRDVWTDLSVFCAALAPYTYSIQMLARTVVLNLHRNLFLIQVKLLNRVLKDFDRFESFLHPKQRPRFHEYHSKQSKYVRIILVVHIIFMAISTFGFFFPIILNAFLNTDEAVTKGLPLAFKLPLLDMCQPSIHKMAAIVLTISFIFYNFKTVIIDDFILGFIVLHYSVLRYHADTLNGIWQEYHEAEPSSDRTFSLHQRIRLWVELHQNILEICSRFKKLASSLCLVILTYNLIHSCIPVFIITSTEAWTLNEKLQVGIVVVGSLISLFLVSQASDVLSVSHGAVAEAMFDATILAKEHVLLKEVFIMTRLRLRKKFQLSAVTVFPLGAAMFGTLIRLIVSYYMTLNEMQSLKQAQASLL